MILERGDIFSMWGKTGLILFTANGDVNTHAELVMGRGFAKQIKDRHPWMARFFGARAQEKPGFRLLVPPYWRSPESADVCCWDLLLPTPESRGCQLVGAFRVKEHWYEAARLDLIQESVTKLIYFTQGLGGFRCRIDLNYPGIGNGRLAKGAVAPIIARLPDNVHVWEQ